MFYYKKSVKQKKKKMKGQCLIKLIMSDWKFLPTVLLSLNKAK